MSAVPQPLYVPAARGAVDDRLLAGFRGVFDPDLAGLSDIDSPESIEGRDCANHVNLVLALEAEFGVEFDTDEIAELTTVATIRERLTAG